MGQAYPKVNIQYVQFFLSFFLLDEPVFIFAY